MYQSRRTGEYRLRLSSTGPLAGGIATLHTPRRISFRGGKFYDIEYPHRHNLVVSTPASTRFAEYKHSLAFNQYVVYKSYGEDHTREGKGGMEFWPTFMTCDDPRMFGDVFDVAHKCRSMEEVWEAAGILDYHRFICGYHIHGVEKSLVDEKLCPLDWYYQSAELRMSNPDLWEHDLILDQVSPVDFWKGRQCQYIGMYEWPNHRIGCDAAWGQ